MKCFPSTAHPRQQDWTRMGGSTSAPASKAIWKRTCQALCMIRKLEWASGHSGLTFRSRKEGSCPGTYGFEGSVPAFYKQYPSLWARKSWGQRDVESSRVPSSTSTKFLPFWGLLQTLSVRSRTVDFTSGVIISSHKVTKDLLLKGAVWGVYTPCIKGV